MRESQAGLALPEVLPSVSRRLTQKVIERYGHASGDLNPLHMKPEVASKSRFEGTIAHGMLVLAYVVESMTEAFGIEWLRSGGLQVKMRNVARPGDTVTAGGSLKSISERESSRRATYIVEARNQRGEALISGEAEVSVPRA
jgi:acyl dehydratase